MADLRKQYAGETTEQRLERLHVPEPNSGCWLWTGRLNRYGYGHAIFDRKLQLAHRVAYTLFKGSIPSGLQLDHLCRVRCCINPDHLEPVTNKENLSRGRNSKRDQSHCVNGHEFTEENTYWYADKGYRHRMCRECASARNKRWKREHRKTGI
jgi:hypothetical protein